MGTGVRVPPYRPRKTRQQRLAYGGVLFGAASFLTVLALQPGLVTQTARQLTDLVREVPMASGPLPGTTLERLPHPQIAASPTGQPAAQPAVQPSTSSGGTTGGQGQGHFVGGTPSAGPGHAPGGHPHSTPAPGSGIGHTAGPITSVIHPPVVIVADDVDQATGGAASPVTGPAVQVVDGVTGALDGALGGGHGQGHAHGHTKPGHTKHAGKTKHDGKTKHHEHVKHGHTKHAAKPHQH